MIKNDSRGLASNEPVCKKIQNYIFKFTDMLGQGNFSKVYKAHHEITNQIVAVKIIQLNSLKSQKLQQLLFSEIDVLKKLNHPNILRCYQVFTSNRNCYIITQICNGGDLQTKLRRQHHFSEIHAQPIIKDIFSGLLYLSQKNVIHRDLKVANVFLHNGRAKIADFGFAKFTRQNFKDINIGSPIYMAPEGLIHNIYGPKTDIWAFGILIFELLHGETPFAQCRTEAQLKYHVSIPLNSKRLRSQLSPQIRQIILLCLETDESKRITAEQLQKLPYFRKLMDKSPLRRMDSPVMEKKYSTASQKNVGSNSSSKNIINRYNFLVSREDQTQQGLYDRESPNKKTAGNLLNQRNRTENKNFSMQKRIYGGLNKQKYNDLQYKSKNNSFHPSPPKKTIHPIDNNTSKIFSAPVNFKQCVNLLHYCRLTYKFVTFLKQSLHNDENMETFLSSWVLTLMEEIKNKINENGVIYQGENAWLRQKKLREVTNQYTKKYQQELIGSKNSETSLLITLNYVSSYFENIDKKILSGNLDESILILGHYIVMIAEGTNIIKKCYNDQNYKLLGGYKDLQVFLNTKKETMDLQSYKLMRKKISFLK